MTDDTAKGIDFSKLDTKSGSVIQPSPHERFTASLIKRAEREGPLISERVSKKMMDNILTAETEDEIWDADDIGTEGGRDLVDVELQFNSIMLAPATNAAYDAPLKVYALIEVQRLETGAESVVNTSAPGLITKIIKLESKIGFPFQGVIRTAGDSQALVLKRLPKRAATVQPPANASAA
jgi:hypothetical protein